MAVAFSRGERADGDSLRRFKTVPVRGVDMDAIGPRPDHPALVEGRTLFPSTVVAAAKAPRLLVSGKNQAKIGSQIQKGPWAGLPIYCLTLEERATCPRSCHAWRQCYGNGMHLARRHRAGADLEARLERELIWLDAEHPQGFAIRLHILGDFYSASYARRWGAWLRRFQRMRIFGFTARPRDSRIGAIINDLNQRMPWRCAIRFSVERPTGLPMEATLAWGPPPADGWHGAAMVCPQQTGGTACCATCGLCWLPSAAHLPIAFVGHGRNLSVMPRRRA